MKNAANIIIFNTNTKINTKNKEIYTLVNYTKKNEDKIIKKISNDENLILNLTFEDNIINEMKDFENFLNKVNIKEIGIKNFLIPSYLMREHPCNAYLCDGWKCKRKISGLPKYIYIDDKYNVYPHDLKYNELIIGNVSNNKLSEILENYYDSDSYKRFIEYAKKVFIKYVAKYPYTLFPIVEYIRMEVENEKQS